MLPYFLKSETSYLGAEHNPYHEAPEGKPGPITVTCPRRCLLPRGWVVRILFC